MPPPVPGPYPPLSRGFRQIELPDGIWFAQMEGWNDHLWLLSGNKLFEHDGTRIVRELELCPGARDSRTGPYSLSATLSGLMALGSDDNEDYVVALISPDFRVVCHTLPRLPAGSLLLTVTTLMRSTLLPLPSETRPYLGISIPSRRAPQLAGFFALRRDSLWLQVWPDSSSLRMWTFHFDGKSWRTVPNPPLAASDMWGDPSGAAWAINTALVTHGKRAPGDRSSMSVLARHEGNQWTLVSTPEWFQPHWMTGTAANDIWFVGRRTVFQRDGDQWRAESFESDLATGDPELVNGHETPGVMKLVSHVA